MLGFGVVLDCQSVVVSIRYLALWGLSQYEHEGTS